MRAEHKTETNLNIEVLRETHIKKWIKYHQITNMQIYS